MLLSIGIKNIILLFLIILIAHFFLNILIEKKTAVDQYTAPTASLVTREDGDGDDALDKYFEVAKGLKASGKDHEVSRNDHSVPEGREVSQSCEIDIEPQEACEAKKIKANCNLNQNKKNIMFLNEYEDEEGMNGGQLYDGLNAFDSFELEYQSYDCTQPYGDKKIESI